MATYYSDRMSSNSSHAIKAGGAIVGDVCEVSVSVALVNNDIIKLFTVPKGARVVTVMLQGVGVQSGTDSEFELGDSGDTERLLIASAGQYLRSNKHDAYFYLNSSAKTTANNTFHTYAANTDIEMKITTAGTGMTTGGKIVAAILYYVD